VLHRVLVGLLVMLMTRCNGPRGFHTLVAVFGLFVNCQDARSGGARATEVSCTVWQFSAQPKSGSGPVHTTPG
jgi:hypothetical protein